MTHRNACLLANVVVTLGLVIGGGSLGCSKDNGGQPAQSSTGASGGSSSAGSGGAGAGAGGAAAGGTGAGGGGGSVSIDLGNLAETSPPPSPTTCSGLRNCVFRCAMDAACRQKCVDQAPSGVRAAYMAVTACSLKGCPDFNDINCRCQRECMGDGECTELVDGCKDFDTDEFCELTCGS
jgi:hypothetical protein